MVNGSTESVDHRIIIYPSTTGFFLRLRLLDHVLVVVGLLVFFPEPTSNCTSVPPHWATPLQSWVIGCRLLRLNFLPMGGRFARAGGPGWLSRQLLLMLRFLAGLIMMVDVVVHWDVLWVECLFVFASRGWGDNLVQVWCDRWPWLQWSCALRQAFFDLLAVHCEYA